jgi:hypothetical protein
MRTVTSMSKMSLARAEHSAQPRLEKMATDLSEIRGLAEILKVLL